MFDVQDEIPAEYVIGVMTTENTLQQIKVNKAVGPDNVPEWVLMDNASTLTLPLTALFNTSLRNGVILANSTVDRNIYSSDFAFLHLFQRFLNQL